MNEELNRVKIEFTDGREWVSDKIYMATTSPTWVYLYWDRVSFDAHVWFRAYNRDHVFCVVELTD